MTTSTPNPPSASGAAVDIDALWNFPNPAESEQRFRDALKRANADEALELETQIARTFSLRHEDAKAHAILDEVQRKIVPTTPEVVRVRLALERGRTLRKPNDFEIARPHFQEAFDRATAAKLTLLAIDAAHMFGFSKDLDEAQRWNERALELAMSGEHPRAIRWRATLTHNMGVSERDRKNYDLALSHFEASELAERTLNRPHRQRIVRWQIANTLRLQGKIDEAFAIQLRIEREADEANAPDVYIYTELAELFDAKRDSTKAKSYATRALALAEKDSWMMENEAKLVERMRALLNN
jgi:tetratricopeptide (TPR) repeat protein